MTYPQELKSFDDSEAKHSVYPAPPPEEDKVDDKGIDSNTNDVAGKFLRELDPSVASTPVTAAESRKVLRKIDWIIIPLLASTVILAAVDKVIISNAAIYGMTEDTGLVGQQYSWVGSIFYFGYLVAEFPAAYLVQRLPVAKFLAACVASWGVLMMCIAATQNFAGLATVRFIFGATEVPAFIIASIMTSMWWTTAEQPIRIAFWFNQVCSHHHLGTISPLLNFCAGLLDICRCRKLWHWPHADICCSLAPPVLSLRRLLNNLGSCIVALLA